MIKCSYANKYKAIKPPKCASGLGCDVCRHKWNIAKAIKTATEYQEELKKALLMVENTLEALKDIICPGCDRKVCVVRGKKEGTWNIAHHDHPPSCRQVCPGSKTPVGQLAKASEKLDRLISQEDIPRATLESVDGHVTLKYSK